MIDKQINTCDFLNICQTDCNGTLEDTEMCHCYELYKQLKIKEQECEKFKQPLTEIKDIAEENIRIADSEGLNGIYRRGLAEQILQKSARWKNESSMV